MPVSKIIFH